MLRLSGNPNTVSGTSLRKEGIGCWPPFGKREALFSDDADEMKKLLKAAVPLDAYGDMMEN